MKQVFFIIACIVSFVISYAQTTDTITNGLVQRYISYLASDSLKGRGNYTPQLHEAAHFIASEFKQNGLQSLSVFPNYFQAFTNKEVPEQLLYPDSLGRYNAEKILLNVIGVLPGKSKPAEAILFTAHYDHIGMDKSLSGDKIFNGANDDASGTTAMLSLAHYYALKNDNERTLIFCAFSGEELGLLGSQALAVQIQADKVVAVVNIEMIGRHNAAGKNAFFITGARYSDFAEIVKKNLKGTGVKMRSEPSKAKQLFQRSDNYSFAKKGIPAHTIMCSDDDDNCYHQTCDEVNRIDIPQMTTIIKAIATACTTIIIGEDTPSRINAKAID